MRSQGSRHGGSAAAEPATSSGLSAELTDFKFKDLPSFAAARFDGVLERSSATSNLNLTNLGITDQHVPHIINRSSSAVWTKLWMNFNKLSDAGVLELVNALANNNHVSRIEELCLANNKLSNISAVQLSQVFAREPNSLRVLDLAGNRKINDESMPALANLIQVSPSLAKLTLTGISMTDAGAAILLNAVQSSNVKYLRVGSDKLSDATVELLESIVRHSCVVQAIVMGPPELSKDKLEQLARLVRVKSSDSGQILVALCSVHHVPRVSTSSQFRLFPQKLMTDLARMLYEFEQV